MIPDVSVPPGLHRRTGRHRVGRTTAPPRHRVPRRLPVPAARGGIAVGLGTVLAMAVTTPGPGTAGTERHLPQRAELAQLAMPAQQAVQAPVAHAALRSVRTTVEVARGAAKAAAVADEARNRSMAAALDLVAQGGEGVRTAAEAAQRRQDRAGSGTSRDRERGTAPEAGQAAGAQYARPVTGSLTSGFGYRWGRMHEGVDYAASYGSAVRAVAAGTVEMTGWTSGLGYQVRVRLDDGTLLVYGHLSQIGVGYGQRVTPGQWLGSVGNSGRSTGPHLHLEVHQGGVPVDPLPWLAARGASR